VLGGGIARQATARHLLTHLSVRSRAAARGLVLQSISLGRKPIKGYEITP